MAMIGFIGLGNMGGPMAANLVRAGHAVRGFDLMPTTLQAARLDGIEVASNAGEAAASAEVVITMLPSGRHVLDLYQNEIVASARLGTLFLDCSTIDVGSARRAHAVAQAAGMESIDAPVSGGVSGAAKGTLTFMLGGADAAVQRATSVLLAMGKRVVHCGGAGTGQAAKICNNLILGISMVAASEGFVLGEKLGLSAQALFDVVSTSSGQCWAVTSNCPVPGPVPSSPANNGYRPGFMVQLMLKDLELAREEARITGVSVPLGAYAARLYAEYAAAGFGKSDFSAIINRVRAEEQHV